MKITFLTNKTFTLLLVPFSVLSTFSAAAEQVSEREQAFEEVLVEADFYQRSNLDTAISLSVLDAEGLENRKATHLEDALNIIPNVNFSSGASRGRFFQIRGVGERSQFVDPINPSVGLIIDGIDFTGVGGAATTLDIKQLEVLRGPQGTLYGANALAGLINMVSNDPSEAGGNIRLNVGQYGTREFSQAVSGPISDNLAMRVAFAKNQSDGYIDNTFLHRDDVNNIDESSARVKLHWQASDTSQLKLTAYYVDADNGYDAFSLDNTRETYSDQPGQDTLQTQALAVQYDYSGFSALRWESTLSVADSETEYGYDEDWSYREICAIDSACAFYQYSTSDNYERENKNISVDTRLLSNASADEFSWVAGFYFRDQDEDLLRTYVNNDPNYDSFYGPIRNAETTLFSSRYETRNTALYTQLSFPLAADVHLVAGARLERREAEYSDSQQERLNNDEDLWGGKLALEYRGIDQQLLYALVSRGYKAGGNNIPGPQDAEGNDLIPIIFDTEDMLNYEIGHKAVWADGKFDTQVAVFYQDRNNIQINQSVVSSRETGELNDNCPCDFLGFIDNGPAGENYGLEVEVNAHLSDRLSAWLSLGVLKTQYQNFLSFSHLEADEDTGTPYDLSGRQQAHAPEYQAAFGADITVVENLRWIIEVEYKDEFFLSPRHNVTTEAYTLFNMRAELTLGRMELALWGKNLSDEDVIVRGFGSFGNDPRKQYAFEPYFQYGAPRVLGVSAALNF